MIRSVICAICFVLVTHAAVGQQVGKVIAVADGDTFTMQVADTLIKVRLHGIDCPENGQAYGDIASKFLSELIFGKTVTVKAMDIDFYGRTIGLVFFDSVNVNEALLKEGLAWHYIRYDKNVRWAEYERVARKAEINIWSQPNPTAPWNFRKRSSAIKRQR